MDFSYWQLEFTYSSVDLTYWQLDFTCSSVDSTYLTLRVSPHHRDDPL